MKSMYFAAVIASAFILGGLSPVRAQEGLGERIGERIDRGLDRLSSEIQENWQSLQRFVDRLGVQGRVYSRLRWDKTMENAELDVDVEEGGLVTLSGVVRSVEAKEVATKLAEETIGVTRVTNRLQVTAPPPAK